MSCSRCQGLMTIDSFIDMEEDTGQLLLSAWRSVNCGQVTDPGVIRNRLSPRLLVIAATRDTDLDGRRARCSLFG
jgi:hypothetical protein